MAINLPDKTINILERLTANKQETLLYTPSSQFFLNTLIKYQGFIYSLRICSSLNSINATFAPLDNPIDTDYQREQKYQLFRASERKTIELSLKKNINNAEKIVITYIECYNTEPIFLSNIMPFLTDLDYYGIEHNVGLYAKIIDNGYGLLENNDTIYFNGVVIEKTSILQDASDQIYNFVGE